MGRKGLLMGPFSLSLNLEMGRKNVYFVLSGSDWLFERTVVEFVLTLNSSKIFWSHFGLEFLSVSWSNIDSMRIVI